MASSQSTSSESVTSESETTFLSSLLESLSRSVGTGVKEESEAGVREVLAEGVVTAVVAWRLEVVLCSEDWRLDRIKGGIQKAGKIKVINRKRIEEHAFEGVKCDEEPRSGNDEIEGRSGGI